MTSRRELVATIGAVAVGIIGGLGIYTFRYAEGLSYFSNDPNACLNCHVMRDQYDSWRKSTHHASATCVECHLPHKTFQKYLAKAENGYYHTKAFTLQDFQEPIRIKPRNLEITQENCLGCHGSLVHELVKGATSAHGAVRCVHCHQSVGHGPTR